MNRITSVCRDYHSIKFSPCLGFLCGAVGLSECRYESYTDLVLDQESKFDLQTIFNIMSARYDGTFATKVCLPTINYQQRQSRGISQFNFLLGYLQAINDNNIFSEMFLGLQQTFEEIIGRSQLVTPDMINLWLGTNGDTFFQRLKNYIVELSLEICPR